MRTSQPATEAQINFVRSLIARRDTSGVTELVDEAELLIMDETITHGDVNRILTVLKVLPMKDDLRKRDQSVGSQIVTVGSKVPEGYYAIGPVGDTRFYRIDRPTTGRWAGYVFLNIQAGNELHPVKNHAERLRVLTLVAEDPRAAAIRYGNEIGRCSQCNKTLTNPDSIAAGIGPICSANAGWS
jgi:hypothetical protein